MNDELVKIKVAKLAKEIGFNELCSHYYVNSVFNHFKENHGHLFKYEAKDIDGNSIGVSFRKNWKGQPHIIIAPTQSLLQKYLREKYNIQITINPIFTIATEVKYAYVIDAYINGKIIRINENFDIYFDSYEKALEVGLEEVLKLIIDEKNITLAN